MIRMALFTLWMLMIPAMADRITALYEAIISSERIDYGRGVKELKNPFGPDAPKKMVQIQEGNTSETILVPVVSEPELNLQAILGQRAKINGNWYEPKKRLHGYYLAKVGADYAVLRSTDGKRQRKIFLPRSSLTIKKP